MLVDYGPIAKSHQQTWRRFEPYQQAIRNPQYALHATTGGVNEAMAKAGAHHRKAGPIWRDRRQYRHSAGAHIYGMRKCSIA